MSSTGDNTGSHAINGLQRSSMQSSCHHDDQIDAPSPFNHAARALQ
jgi:hypothetical protein